MARKRKPEAVAGDSLVDAQVAMTDTGSIVITRPTDLPDSYVVVRLGDDAAIENLVPKRSLHLEPVFTGI